MPAITVNLSEGEDAEFGELLVAACAREVLSRHLDGDEDGAREPTRLKRQLEAAVVDVIREEARGAAAGIAKQVLESGVLQRNTYGEPAGGRRSVAEIVADEVVKQCSFQSRSSSTSRGESAVEQLIRDEVKRQIAGELKQSLDAAKRVVTEALTAEATTALQNAVRGVLPL